LRHVYTKIDVSIPAGGLVGTISIGGYPLAPRISFLTSVRAGVVLLSAGASLIGMGGAPCGASLADAAGTIRVNYPVFRMTLFPEGEPDGGPRFRKIEGQDGKASVPPGRYAVLNWEVESRDTRGRTWKVVGNMLPRSIEVRAGDETRVPLAAPLQAHLYTFPAAQTALFRMTYTGSMGERVREIRVDGVEPAPPWLQILDAAGKVIEVLPFEPG
jgi:hypothetical protein